MIKHHHGHECPNSHSVDRILRLVPPCAFYRTLSYRLNVPYTGANAAFYEPSKVEMKMAAMYYGVQVGSGPGAFCDAACTRM